MRQDALPDPVIAAFAGPLAALAEGPRVAVTLGGSRARAGKDLLSDYDFRVYADAFAPPESAPWAEFNALWADHEARGIRIDGAWTRRISVIDGELDEWLIGRARPTECDWAIWGYHLPTDLAHQIAVHDPQHIAAGWRARLRPYPDALRDATLARNMRLLRYWRDDYHYASKVARNDRVFLAALTSRLVHAILQVVFALNRSYYPGDGWNLTLVVDLPEQPERLYARIDTLLACPDAARQRADLIRLIDDLAPLLPPIP